MNQSKRRLLNIRCKHSGRNICRPVRSTRQNLFKNTRKQIDSILEVRMDSNLLENVKAGICKFFCNKN